MNGEFLNVTTNIHVCHEMSGPPSEGTNMCCDSNNFCVTLVNDQLDAQLLYFIIQLLQSSTCFEQCHALHQVKLY